MIDRSRCALSEFPTPVRAGTSGETPPRPCMPWHLAQANWTKTCAPAATFGSKAAPAVVVVAPPAATVTVFAFVVSCPTTQPTTAAANASPSAMITMPASRTTGEIRRFGIDFDHTTLPCRIQRSANERGRVSPPNVNRYGQHR